MQNLREQCYAVSRQLDPYKETSPVAKRIQRIIDNALNAARGRISGESYAKSMRLALDLAETFLRSR